MSYVQQKDGMHDQFSTVFKLMHQRHELPAGSDFDPHELIMAHTHPATTSNFRLQSEPASMQTTAALQHKSPATASVTGTFLRPLQQNIVTYSQSISPPVTTTQLTPPMNLQLLQAAANSGAMGGSSAGTHLDLLSPLTD
jgi:hypothetical protein